MAGAGKRKKSSAQHDFVLDIEANALSSLRHGIDHFVAYDTNPSDLKFALIHVFHAVELFLKARLAKEHHLLIYAKPESMITGDSYTVGFDALVARLRNAGISFQREDLESLDFLRKIRNSIEHHEIKANRDEVKAYIGRAARFLERFINDELALILQNEVDDPTYQTLKEAIYSYKERVERAKSELENSLPGDPKDRMEYGIESCPECGENTIVIPDDTSNDGRVHCFFCGERFSFEACDRCGRKLLFGPGFASELTDAGMCEECWEEIMRRN